jgi:ABC-type sugar transport system ATPase subunit
MVEGPNTGTTRQVDPSVGERRRSVLEVRDLTMSFDAVRAARGISFELYPGEVLGLLGDNGAGKSTVVSCIAGSLTPDAGVISVDGREVTIDDPQAARRLGIETVFQDLALVDSLDVTTNMFLNREILKSKPARWLRWMDRGQMHRESQEILDRLHIRINSVKQPMSQLSGGQRQSVAVGRAVAWGHHIVLLDEPAAALGVEQTALVLELINRLRDEGVGVVLISHNMHDVLSVCDRAVVLRHGLKVAQLETLDGLTTRHLVDLITGVSLGEGDVARHSEAD